MKLTRLNQQLLTFTYVVTDSKETIIRIMKTENDVYAQHVQQLGVFIGLLRVIPTAKDTLLKRKEKKKK